MSWMKSFVCPPEDSRTVSTSLSRPGRNRSSPIRSSGPLGMSRIPVASTTIAPGRPRAKRAYQPSTSGVTSPSAVARQGTIAGTQVRVSSIDDPTAIGWNSRARAASARSGQRPGSEAHFMRCGGRHMPCPPDAEYTPGQRDWRRTKRPKVWPVSALALLEPGPERGDFAAQPGDLGGDQTRIGIDDMGDLGDRLTALGIVERLHGVHDDGDEQV